MASWTEHRDGSMVSWQLEGTKWRVCRTNGSRFSYACWYGSILHAVKDELVNAKRHCERDGQPFLMPWGWTTTPEAGS